MTTPDLIFDGPDTAPATILLAHGAGGAMDSPGMNAITAALVHEGLQVARFEFSYMAGRRSGQRKPPPKAETLIPEYRAVLHSLRTKTPRVIVGGKSMGGRIASMLQDDMPEGDFSGILCLGYPFHPVGKPEQLRTAHLETLRVPTLIVQGTRDPFGTRDEVADYRLSPSIRIVWMEDGDHDLKPRKSVSGFTQKEHLASMAREVREWIVSLPR